MSTRSVIAEQRGDGWAGRYCHSDGYPSWNGRVIFELVNGLFERDVERALDVLVRQNYGWWSIDNRPGQQELSEGYRDGRFASVPGVGVAYTTQDGQSSEDQWISPETDDWGAEWAYVLTQSGMTVLHNACSDGWTHVGFVHWNDEAQDWTAYQAVCERLCG